MAPHISPSSKNRASMILINPDTRPLPPGWHQNFDSERQAWYYVQVDVLPLTVSYEHPASLLVPAPLYDEAPLPGPQEESSTTQTKAPSALVPSSIENHTPAERKLSTAQQLYASAINKQTSGSPGVGLEVSLNLKSPATSAPPIPLSPKYSGSTSPMYIFPDLSRGNAQSGPMDLYNPTVVAQRGGGTSSSRRTSRKPGPPQSETGPPHGTQSAQLSSPPENPLHLPNRASTFPQTQLDHLNRSNRNVVITRSGGAPTIAMTASPPSAEQGSHPDTLTSPGPPSARYNIPITLLPQGSSMPPNSPPTYDQSGRNQQHPVTQVTQSPTQLSPAPPLISQTLSRDHPQHQQQPSQQTSPQPLQSHVSQQDTHLGSQRHPPRHSQSLNQARPGSQGYTAQHIQPPNQALPGPQWNASQHGQSPQPSPQGHTPQYNQPPYQAQLGHAPQYGQPHQGQPGPQGHTPQHSQPRQVQPGPQGHAPQHNQTRQVQPGPQGHAPQYSQPRQVQPGPQGHAPQYSQPHQVQPGQQGHTPQYSQPHQVQPGQQGHTPQYSQPHQVQPGQQGYALQSGHPPNQVQPSTQGHVPLYSQRPNQVQPGPQGHAPQPPNQAQPAPQGHAPQSSQPFNQTQPGLQGHVLQHSPPPSQVQTIPQGYAPLYTQPPDQPQLQSGSHNHVSQYSQSPREGQPGHAPQYSQPPNQQGSPLQRHVPHHSQSLDQSQPVQYTQPLNQMQAGLPGYKPKYDQATDHGQSGSLPSPHQNQVPSAPQQMPPQLSYGNVATQMSPPLQSGQQTTQQMAPLQGVQTPMAGYQPIGGAGQYQAYAQQPQYHLPNGSAIPQLQIPTNYGQQQPVYVVLPAPGGPLPQPNLYNGPIQLQAAYGGLVNPGVTMSTHPGNTAPGYAQQRPQAPSALEQAGEQLLLGFVRGLAGTTHHRAPHHQGSVQAMLHNPLQNLSQIVAPPTDSGDLPNYNPFDVTQVDIWSGGDGQSIFSDTTVVDSLGDSFSSITIDNSC